MTYIEAKALTIFSQPLSESDKRRLSKYGKLPRGGLLAQQSKVNRI